jgi:putative ABC transport system permease protein
MSSALGRGNLLARALEGVTLALDSVRANKMRAALTILGIAIGVMVVIAMAAMITGIQGSVNEVVSRAGPNSFMVTRYFRDGIQISDGSDEMSPWRRRPRLDRHEANLIRALPAVEEVNVREGGISRVSYRDRDLGESYVQGVDPAWLKVEGGDMIDGRNFNAVEAASSAYVVVINTNAAESLFERGSAVGKSIRIFGLPFTVVGLYQDPSEIFSDSDQPKIMIPHSTFTKAADFERGWINIMVFPRPDVTQAEAMDQVTVALRIDRKLRPGDENNFDLVSGARFMESFNSMTAGFFLVMLVLSSVGLMVGGVGVVAIMMISVTERTREIGVRKALGATRGEILFQFLIEAATLTVLGGLVGMAMGAVIAWGVNSFTPIPASIPLWSVAAAIGASAITGICFGLYPANKAARMDPVEALRYE